MPREGEPRKRMPADELDRQIGESPENVDQNLNRLEQEASDARMYVRIAAIGLAVLVLAGAGYLVYRRVKRPPLANRLRSRLLESLRDLPSELPSRLSDLPSRWKERIPRVSV
jgi:hypothetical protein